MFYQTQIKSLFGGGAVDTEGKRLIFIGYLPVKEGDTVYTDGTVIFGNAPPRGMPTIVDTPSGVPVLGDDLRGYFDKHARFRHYQIAQDDWIVNSKRKFSHGSIALNAEKIIDADLADNNDSLFVTNGFLEQSHNLYLFLPAIHFLNTRTWGGEWNYIAGSSRYTPFYTPMYVLAQEQILGFEETVNVNRSVKLFRNDALIKSLSLNAFVQDVQARALAVAESIMALSFNDADIYPYRSFDGENFYTKRHPTETDTEKTISTRPTQPFIAHSVARVLSCNISEDSFGGVVFAAAYGYCFPFIKSRLKYSFNYPKFLREWKCVPFGVSCLYEMTDAAPVPFASRGFGGIDSTVSVFGDDTDGWLVDQVTGAFNGTVSALTNQRRLALLPNYTNQSWNSLMPVSDGFFTMDKFGRVSFFDAEKTLVADNIPVHKDFYHIEIQHGFFQPELYLYSLNDKPRIKALAYTADGSVEELSLDNDSATPPLDGYFIKQPDNSLTPLQFTPLFYQFKNGSYLFGFREGKLYLKRNDEISLVADRVKNFRLRELKNIAKAKR